MKENRNIHIITGEDYMSGVRRLVKRYAPLLAKLFAELFRGSSTANMRFYL